MNTLFSPITVLFAAVYWFSVPDVSVPENVPYGILHMSVFRSSPAFAAAVRKYRKLNQLLYRL